MTGKGMAGMQAKAMVAVWLLASGSLAAGCADLRYGHYVFMGRADQIQPGRTTREEVIKLLGKPEREIVRGDRRILYYGYYDAKGNVLEHYVTLEGDVVAAYLEKK